MHINMKKEKKYIEYILKQAEALLAIDSPSGFTEKVTDYLCESTSASATNRSRPKRAAFS